MLACESVFLRSEVTGEWLLQDISFSVEPGSALVVQGENASGKSALARLFAGLIFAQSGVVSVFSRNVKKLRQSSVHLLRRKIGYLPQETELFDERTVFENVSLMLEINAWPLRDIRPATLAMLDRVGLLSLENVPAFRLSTSQKKRVAIARALVHKPSVVVADEPTGDIDAKGREMFLSLIGETLGQSGSVLLATSDPVLVDAACICQWQCAELRDGTLVMRHNLAKARSNAQDGQNSDAAGQLDNVFDNGLDNVIASEEWIVQTTTNSEGPMLEAEGTIPSNVVPLRKIL